MLRTIEDENLDEKLKQAAAAQPPAGEDSPDLGLATGKLITAESKKRPAWLIFLTDIFNGIIMAATIMLTAALLTASYAKEPYPLLAWIAFIPFGVAVFHIKRGLSGFFYGLLTGTATYLGVLYWIMPTVLAGTGNQQMASAAVLALSLTLGLQFALFGLICVYLRRIRWAFPLTGACAWVSLELLHQFIAYKTMAFPWFVLGYTQFNQKALIQLSSYGGAYAISFLIMFFALGIAAASSRKAWLATRIAWFALPAALIGCMILLGNSILTRQQEILDSNPQKITVALMQPYTHKLLLEGFEEDVIYTIYEQAARLEGKHTDLIIWPESSYPGSFEDDGYYNFLKEVSAKTDDAYQITGSYVLGPGGDYVSAALFDETGLLDVYNKIKLVPFGEFLPFYGLFKNLYESHNIAALTGSFIPGNDPGKVFTITLKHEGDQQKPIRFGAGICFESLFPKIWRAQAANGAQFFVNISNDGWFLDTAAPYQHLRVNIFRAVENRRPVLRSTNTGISAWIGSLGTVRFESNFNKQETARLNFAFHPYTAKTFYTLYGDVFAYICAVIAATFFIFSVAFLNKADYDRA